MAIRYSEALGILRQVAEERAEREDGRDVEYVRLEDAVGRIAAQDHVSPTSIPEFDISATDGYAISSIATENADKKKVTFVVKGTIAVGDEPPEGPPHSGNGIPSCFEIMNGGQFPRSTSGEVLDACVRGEDVVPTVFGMQKMITIVEPVPKGANRRFAGSDFEAGHQILPEGEKIQSRHIMALGSAGISTVAVRRQLRVAVSSVGSRFLRSEIMVSTVPFLIASLRELGVDAKFVGMQQDDSNGFAETFTQQVEDGTCDIILTTGGAPREKTKSVLPAMDAMGGRVRFRGVMINPGHTVLFATLPSSYGDVPLFWLPGTPMETAVCFRFLVLPFIKQLSGFRDVGSKILRIQTSNWCENLAASCPPQSDCFRHGMIQHSDRGEEVVVLNFDKSPANVSHFAASNCWVHIPRGHSGSYRDTLVYCYAHTSGISP